MPGFLELIEVMRAEEASIKRLFGKEGTRVRGRRKDPKYMAELVEAARFIADVFEGSRPAYQLVEAMSTSDFPQLFGDTIDRQMLANYAAAPSTFRAWCRVAQVPDFRTVKRFVVDGGEARLTAVAEDEEYPEASVSDDEHTYSVAKYGRKMPFHWETMVNDDLNALKDIPARFAKAAARTEEYFATSLICDASGPHASNFTGGTNQLTGNPVLSIDSLQTAFQYMAVMLDSDSEPISIDGVHLVVTPALSVVAKNYMNAVQFVTNKAGGFYEDTGKTKQELEVVNWMKSNVTLHVDSQIPRVCTTANGTTSWFLIADPGRSRPAVEVGFLRGHVTPEIFMKQSNQVRVGGGGGVNPMDGDFDSDAVEYKVRHVVGGTFCDTKAIVGSNGSGS